MPSSPGTPGENDREVYGQLITLRNTELQVFWARYNTLVILNGGYLSVALAVNQSLVLQHASPSLLPGLGTFFAAMWLWMVVAGEWWLRRWERQLREIEDRRRATERLFSFENRFLLPYTWRVRTVGAFLPAVLLIGWIVYWMRNF